MKGKEERMVGKGKGRREGKRSKVWKGGRGSC